MKLARKIIHILMGTSIILSIIFFYDNHKNPLIFTLGAIVLFGFTMDFIRTVVPELNKVFIEVFFHKLLYKNELGGINSATFFFFSSLFCIIFFDKLPAIIAIATLTYADSLASLIGYKFGRIKINTKSLEGSLVFATIGLAITSLFLPLWKAVLISITVAVVELISIKIDDNLTIPIATGFLVSILGGVS